MSIDITLRQTAAKKKALPLDVILGEELIYGAFDGLRTNPGQMGERDFIAWNPDHIGRGFSVEWQEGEKRKVTLRLPLPSFNEEIRDFYNCVERIASFWNCGVEEDGEKAELSVFMSGLEAVQETNDRMIIEMAEQVFMGEKDGSMIMPAAVWQLAVGKEEARVFLRAPEKFAGWLDEHQAVDAYYAMAQFFGRGEKTIGRFTLPAGVPTILPRIPQVPFGYIDTVTGLPLVCEDWEIAFYDSEEQKLFACMDYDSFLDRVDATQCERFDGDCFLAQGMDMKELKRVAGIE